MKIEEIIQLLKDCGCRECEAFYGNDYDRHINYIAEKILKQLQK